MLTPRLHDGMSNKEIAEANKTSAVNTARDMILLEDMGWAKKMANGRWTLTTKPLALLQAYQNHFQSLQNRMTETTHNITAAAAALITGA